jgi:hypothetical protein
MQPNPSPPWSQEERGTTPRKLNYYLIVFQDMFLYFHSLFLVIGKEAKEQRDIVWEDVGCIGVTRSTL